LATPSSARTARTRLARNAAPTGSAAGTPAPRRRLARGPAALLALLVAMAGFVVVPATNVGAEPPISPAAARRELERLDAEVDNAVEEYNEARIALSKAQRHAAALQGRVARAEAALAAHRRRMGGFISAAYQSGGIDTFVTLMTEAEPTTFLDQAAALDQIARDQAGQLRELKAAARRLKVQQDEAKAAVEATKAVERRLAAARTAVESRMARQQQLLDIVEDRAARDARAARAADLARRQRASRAATPAVGRTYTGTASGRAKIAVAEAYRQLGKPYRWGAAGPNSFDCSGLTMWVWAKAGVSLPHSSRMQIQYGRRVSKSELLPGDLVFFGSPIHHVGIYVGNGQYIAAPQTGDVVGFRSVNRPNYAGATRL
jgi:cell wall-associated NlpC family hydrolase